MAVMAEAGSSPPLDADPSPDAVAGDLSGKVNLPEFSNKAVADQFQSRVASSKRERRQRYSEWQRNVHLRIGHTANLYTQGVTVEDDQQTTLNPDWALTKTKTANLYSQVPTVQVTHENKAYAAAVPAFAKALNYELGQKRANVGVPMDEVLNDVVNAAGVGAVVVSYTARFDQVEIPTVDTSMFPPDVVQKLIASKQIPTQMVPRPVDYKFETTRISPTDLLWPAEFTGSDFDRGPWIGYTGRASWAEAKNDFKLRDEDKSAVTGGDNPNSQDNLRFNPDKTALAESERVKYDRVFYWRYMVDPDEKSFSAIWQIVWVDGLPDPVLHEPWQGQQYDQQSRQYMGVRRFPVRVLTLTYITDNPVPPSDSAAGRPQVLDLQRSRSQMFKSRDRSTPIRWFDTNRVDPLIADNLMRGVVQGMIPVSGDGNKSIGEIARASYPAEDFSFDRETKADLMDTWQVGPNQLGNAVGGDTTKAEVQTIQANFATRIGQERARVASFFLGIADVLAGMMVLYSDFPNLTPQERQAMQQAWDFKHITHEIVLKVRPDSTILLDSQQRMQRLITLLNLTVKSGLINPTPIISEMIELSGLDPSEILKPPTPPKPEEPNISYRFSGKDDLYNPVIMAMLIKAGHAPNPQELDAAKKLLQAAQAPAAPPAPPQPQIGPGGPPPPAPGGVQGPPAQGPPPPLALPPGEVAHPDWHLASKVAQRSDDASL